MKFNIKPEVLAYTLVAFAFLGVVALTALTTTKPLDAKAQREVKVEPDAGMVDVLASPEDIPEFGGVVAPSAPDEVMEVVEMDESALQDMEIVTLTDEERRQIEAEIMSPQRVDPSLIAADMPVLTLQEGTYVMEEGGLRGVKQSETPAGSVGQIGTAWSEESQSATAP